MSIPHATQPAEEGGVIPPDTGGAFAVKRAQFEERISAHNRAARETAAATRAHLAALGNRLTAATDALESRHLGLARAHLEIGRRDFEAALSTLPES